MRKSAVIALALAIVCVACTSPTGSTTATANTASTYTPVTGIEVDAHSLFLRQGCGTAPGQVYKYVAIVLGPPCPTDASAAPKSVMGVGTYDCFADAIFVNVGGNSALGLSATFDVVIDAFDAPTYTTQAGSVAATVQDLANPANACVNSSIDERLAAIADVANYTTTCQAIQQPNVQSLVACGPLEPPASALPDAGGD